MLLLFTLCITGMLPLLLTLLLAIIKASGGDLKWWVVFLMPWLITIIALLIITLPIASLILGLEFIAK